MEEAVDWLQSELGGGPQLVSVERGASDIDRDAVEQMRDAGTFSLP